MEVKHYLLLLDVGRRGLPLEETEYFCDNLPLLLVGLSLLEVLGRILIELRGVQEGHGFQQLRAFLAFGWHYCSYLIYL